MSRYKTTNACWNFFFRNMENASGKNKNSGLVSFFVAWNLLEINVIFLKRFLEILQRKMNIKTQF